MICEFCYNLQKAKWQREWCRGPMGSSSRVVILCRVFIVGLHWNLKNFFSKNLDRFFSAQGRSRATATTAWILAVGTRNTPTSYQQKCLYHCDRLPDVAALDVLIVSADKAPWCRPPRHELLAKPRISSHKQRADAAAAAAAITIRSRWVLQVSVSGTRMFGTVRKITDIDRLSRLTTERQCHVRCLIHGGGTGSSPPKLGVQCSKVPLGLLGCPSLYV